MVMTPSLRQILRPQNRELIVNGDFVSDATGWTGAGATPSFSSNTLRGVGGGVGTVIYSTGFPVTIRPYRCTFEIKGDGAYALLQFGFRRTSVTGSFLSNSVTPSITTSLQSLSYIFTPTSAVSDATFCVRFGGTEAINISKVSVKEFA